MGVWKLVQRVVTRHLWIGELVQRVVTQRAAVVIKQSKFYLA